MSRIESGRMVLKNEEFAFREFLEQINIIISGQCTDKGLQYECNVIGPVRDFYIGDDMKLKQVLINILGNSVKFTDVPGRVTLTVEATEENGENCSLCFRMQDTGIGMDPEYIPKLFEAFSQENASAAVFEEDVESSLQAGMNAHLSKPIEPDRLYSVLVELIGEKG